MVNKFNKNDFKEMPWKNGGGITTELFRIPAKNDDGAFIFRISTAQVSTNGPFSIFPNIDRTLLLLEGNGFHLKSPERDFILNKKLIPFHFRGEEVFQCTLCNGACSDFNIMTDRRYANTSISVVTLAPGEKFSVNAKCDLKFIYDIDKESLYQLSRGDGHIIEAESRSSYIVIDTTIL